MINIHQCVNVYLRKPFAKSRNLIFSWRFGAAVGRPWQVGTRGFPGLSQALSVAVLRVGILTNVLNQGNRVMQSIKSKDPSNHQIIKRIQKIPVASSCDCAELQPIGPRHFWRGAEVPFIVSVAGSCDKWTKCKTDCALPRISWGGGFLKPWRAHPADGSFDGSSLRCHRLSLSKESTIPQSFHNGEKNVRHKWRCHKQFGDSKVELIPYCFVTSASKRSPVSHVKVDKGLSYASWQIT